MGWRKGIRFDIDCPLTLFHFGAFEVGPMMYEVCHLMYEKCHLKYYEICSVKYEV